MEPTTRNSEAEPVLQSALTIKEKALGPDHPDVGISLDNLASLYFSQRDWARAADYWRKSTGVLYLPYPTRRAPSW
jgi:Tetratricopeptide repeat